MAEYGDSTSRPSADEIYEKYSQMLYRICYSEMKNEHDAEDAVQDVFVKYILKTPTFDSEEHEKAWFIRVAINRCHDLHRHSMRHATAALEEAEEEAAEEDRGVLKEVMVLPEIYRMPIILFYFEELSLEETARALSISLSAVKMRLKRAKEILKISLEDIQ